MTALSRLTANARPADTALVHDGRRWTYGELRSDADTLAAAMRTDELAGERVALMLPNSPELVITYLACFAAGAIATPLNERFAPPEVERALRRARPRWIVAHANRLPTLEQVDPSLISDVRIVVVDDTRSTRGESFAALLDARRAQAHDAAPPAPELSPETPAVMFFTSGSTGRPKGVVHSHESAHAMLTSTSEALGDVRPDDIVQVFEPQVHVSGFIATFTTLLSGGTVALYDTFDPQTYVEALTTHRPTLICTHIDVLAQLLRMPGVNRDWFSSLRGVYTGGDTVPAAVQRAFCKVAGLPIGVGYGMTEAIWLTVQREPRTDADGCIGRTVDSARLRTDEATGEILVAGPMMMQRYWQDEEITAETLRDRWLRTGDLGRQDPDGAWWFTGRMKDIIVRRTSKITPGEIEGALDQNPHVAMAAVVAAPDPDEGQVPVAFVVPVPGTQPSPADLTSFLADRIAAYKIPARFHLRSALPLTPSGKIARHDLHEDPAID